MGEYPWRDEERLRDLYHGEGLTLYEMADRFGCHHVTVFEWMGRHGIETRGNSGAQQKRRAKEDHPWKDERRLRRLYVEERLTQPEIADKLGCSDGTISRWIDRYDIKLPWEDETTLRELYHGKKMSYAEVADELGCAKMTVQRWMHRHGIERRESGTATSIANSGKETAMVLHDESQMRDLYVGRGLKTEGIAEEIGSSTRTVNYWLQKHGIGRRKAGNYRVSKEARRRLGDADWLTEQYDDQERSLEDIANVLNCTIRTVVVYMESHGIDRRGFPEAVGSGPDHAGWKGGNREYGPDWPKKREQALERDGYRCQACGLTNDDHLRLYNQELHVHHIHPRREFMDGGELDHERANRLDNLITLCMACHRKWEGIPLRPDGG